jgi:hypothetical protein
MPGAPVLMLGCEYADLMGADSLYTQGSRPNGVVSNRIHSSLADG